MADITMCQDKKCPKRENCYRYKVKPSLYRQSYFVRTPRKEDNTCEYYWEDK